MDRKSHENYSDSVEYMKTKIKTLLAVIAGMILFANPVFAGINGGITPASLFYLSGTSILPQSNLWTIGNSTSNASFNNLTVSGTCTGCGGGGSSNWSTTSQNYWASQFEPWAQVGNYITPTTTIGVLFNSSTTLQNFTGLNSTTTNATTTNIDVSNTATVGAGNSLATLTVSVASSTPAINVQALGSSSPAFYIGSANNQSYVGLGTNNPISSNNVNLFKPSATTPGGGLGPCYFTCKSFLDVEGIITGGGVNSNLYNDWINLSYGAGAGTVAIGLGTGSLFSLSDQTVFGTNDEFFQFIPASQNSNTVFEGYSDANFIFSELSNGSIPTNGNIEFYANNRQKESMRITPQFKIGIASTSPFAELSVQATSSTPVGTYLVDFASTTGTDFLIDNKDHTGFSTTSPVTVIDDYTSASSTANLLLESGSGGGCLIVKDAGAGGGYTELYTVAGTLFSKVASNYSQCN